MKTTRDTGKSIKEGCGLASLTILLLWAFCLPSFGLEDPDEMPAKPCPKPYVKTISPRTAEPLTDIKVRGSRFGNEAGSVTFTPGVNGKIVSWSNKRIFVEVPEDAQTGPVTVTSPCGSVSNTQHFTINTKEEEY